MTPHIEAKLGDYADTVLFPGDPLRAKWIAETYLSDVKCVNTVRNMLGFTGYYKDKRISVQGSGMGQPSMSIYAHELYNVYGVDKIIRVGSCGGINPKVSVGDIVVATSACTDSAMGDNVVPGFKMSPAADYDLMSNFINVARKTKNNLHIGTITSNDYFYQPDPDWWRKLGAAGVLAVEMEAYALYLLAMRYNKRALAVSTVSDSLCNKEEMSSAERQTGFSAMLELVLESI
jgi:purine-nucleoside phosphorylase